MSDISVIFVAEQGPAGPGIAAGGETNYVLAKASADDYDTTWISVASATGVTSVNGQTGTVVLDLADLEGDSTHRTVTDAQIAAWDEGGSGAVSSVNGLTGAVVLTKASLSLGNVDNTSDASKPISTAVQTALDAKQATLVSGTNIKTINSQSLLGTGDIVISGGTTYHPITLGIDNGDTVIPTGTTAQVVAAYAGTITGWRILGTPTATVEVDVRKKAEAVPSSSDSIVASATPALTAASVASSTTLTGWTTTVAAGDVLVMSVTANNLATRITLVLEVVA